MTLTLKQVARVVYVLVAGVQMSLAWVAAVITIFVVLYQLTGVAPVPSDPGPGGDMAEFPDIPGAVRSLRTGLALVLLGVPAMVAMITMSRRGVPRRELVLGIAVPLSLLVPAVVVATGGRWLLPT